jgi:Tol biopolymer transport system component
MRKWALLGAIICGLLTPAATAAPQSAKPQLTGTLFFHRYSSYQAWDASMWSLDLITKKLTRLDAGWVGMYSPINAHPSRTGQLLTFMGSATGLDAPEWDVFMSRRTATGWSEPTNLTGPNGKRDEDPKFSPDGSTIIYKEDGVLATVSIADKSKEYLTTGEPESSMPYYTPDGKGILFERGGDIFLMRDGKSIKMKAPLGISSYYPIAVDSARFLFTRVQTSKHDGIFWGYYNGAKPTPLFFNSQKFDSSDSYPYKDGKQFIFLVSGDFSIFKGGYNLMVADLKNKKNWDIDKLYGDVNSFQEELGPSWTAVRYK